MLREFELSTPFVTDYPRSIHSASYIHHDGEHFTPQNGGERTCIGDAVLQAKYASGRKEVWRNFTSSVLGIT
ncbi:hypothetical protein PseAD21_12075 [Pseudomonas sp. AD21]|nr:hypothetical protein PseAD21_12075 [Pseudomonas sp. AD21]